MGANQAQEKKYQIFVSSTYEDLKEERAAVFQAILDLGHIPVGMEQFPASNMSQIEYIAKMLENCDYYILILAGRYGSIDPIDGISYTEIEYNYAVENKIPIMSFIFEDINRLSFANLESSDSGREKLNKFREKVSTSKMIKKYYSVESLQMHVAISLQKCINDFPARGWIRADSIDNDDIINKKIEKYMEEHLTPLTDEEISKLIP